MDAIEADGGRPAIAAGDLRELMVKRDAAGLRLVAVQLPLILVGLVASAYLGGGGHPAWPLAVLVASLGVLATFPAMHEAGHGTAFASRGWNRAVLTVSAFAMLMAPTFFQEFHWQHHRKTQDRVEDPEISGAPALLDGWPSNPVTYLLLISGQLLMVGKAMFVVACAFMPGAKAWERVFPFVRPAKRRRVAWESRATLAAWAAVGWLGFAHVDGFGYALLAWPGAHLLLGLYLIPEHTGLPNEGTQLQRTRTVISNAPLRWWMWNMPLHGVHHAYPAIPFHAVPQAHAAIEDSLEHVMPGYLAVHAHALRHAFRLTGKPRP